MTANNKINVENKIEAVAITGVTGMIGSTLARMFASQGVKVYGFARKSSTKLQNLCGSYENKDN